MTSAQKRARLLARQNGRAAIRWMQRAQRWRREDVRFTIAQNLAVQAARFAIRWAVDSKQPAAR